MTALLCVFTCILDTKTGYKLIRLQPSPEVQHLLLLRFGYECLKPTCDNICEVLIVRLPQQPDQRRNSVGVLDGDLIVQIFAV